MGRTGRARTTKTVMMTMKMGRRVRARRMTVGRMRKTMRMMMVRRRKAVEMRRMGQGSQPSMATLLIWKRGMEIMRRLETKKRTTTLKTRRMRRREGGRRENWKGRRKGGKQRRKSKGEPVKYVQLALVSLTCGQ